MRCPRGRQLNRQFQNWAIASTFDQRVTHNPWEIYEILKVKKNPKIWCLVVAKPKWKFCLKREECKLCYFWFWFSQMHVGAPFNALLETWEPHDFLEYFNWKLPFSFIELLINYKIQEVCGDFCMSRTIYCKFKILYKDLNWTAHIKYFLKHPWSYLCTLHFSPQLENKAAVCNTARAQKGWLFITHHQKLTLLPGKYLHYATVFLKLSMPYFLFTDGLVSSYTDIPLFSLLQRGLTYARLFIWRSFQNLERN